MATKATTRPTPSRKPLLMIPVSPSQMFMDSIDWAQDGGLDFLEPKTRELVATVMEQAARRVRSGQPLPPSPPTTRRRRK